MLRGEIKEYGEGERTRSGQPGREGTSFSTTSEGWENNYSQLEQKSKSGKFKTIFRHFQGRNSVILSLEFPALFRAEMMKFKGCTFGFMADRIRGQVDNSVKFESI